MPKLLHVAGILLLASIFYGCADPPRPAMDFKLVPLNDVAKTTTLADFKGKTLLLDFWATWCIPCRNSMPTVQALYEQYHSKGLEVASITNENRQLVLEYHKSTPFTYPIYLDLSSATAKEYKVNTIPRFVLIKDGKIIWSDEGEENLQQEVSKAMGD